MLEEKAGLHPRAGLRGQPRWMPGLLKSRQRPAARAHGASAFSWGTFSGFLDPVGVKLCLAQGDAKTDLPTGQLFQTSLGPDDDTIPRIAAHRLRGFKA